MKKSAYILLLALAALTLMMAPGCRKAGHNHHLSGNWQIMKIENLATGEVTNPESAFIALNLHVVNLTPNGPSGNMHFDYDQMRLSMDFPYVDKTKPTALYRFGIFTNPVVFSVEKLDSKQLILRSPESLVTCRRF